MQHKQLSRLLIVLSNSLEIQNEAFKVSQDIEDILLDKNIQTDVFTSTIFELGSQFGFHLTDTPFGYIRKVENALCITESNEILLTLKTEKSRQFLRIDQSGDVHTLNDYEEIESYADGVFKVFSVSKLEGITAAPGEVGTIRKLFKLLALEKQDITAIYIYAVLSGILSLTMPLGIQQLVMIVTAGVFPTQAVTLLIFILIGTLFAGIVYVLQLTVVEDIQRRIYARGAFDFIRKVPLMQVESALRQNASELMNRFFDVLNIQKGILKLLSDYSTATLQVLFGLLLLSFYHPYFILFSITLIIIVVALIRLTGSKGLETSIQESKFKYKMAHWLQQSARNLNALQNRFGIQFSWTRADELISGYLYKRGKHFNILVVQYISLIAFKVLVTAALLILGIVLLVDQQITLGQFVASEIILLTVFAAIEKLLFSFEVIYDVLTAVEKVNEINAVELRKNQGLVLSGDNKHTVLQCEGLAISNGSGALLKDVNLKLESGNLYALTGKSGSGKTLLFRTLAGTHKTLTGTMKLNTVSFSHLSSSTLVDHINLVDTSSGIFQGTLRENLTLDKRSEFSEIQKVLKALELDGWADNLPQGFKTTFQSYDPFLPGSVAIRLLMARSILVGHSIIMMDGLLDQIENALFVRIMKNLKVEYPERIFLISTHRRETLEFSDHIILLDEGKIASQGSFETIRESGCLNTLFAGGF